MSGKYVDVIRKIIVGYGKQTNFSRFVGKVSGRVHSPTLEQCDLVLAEQDRVKVEFKVTEDMTNGWQTLHGGCTATLVDMVTTTALFASDRPDLHPGVSVDMALSWVASRPTSPAGTTHRPGSARWSCWTRRWSGEARPWPTPRPSCTRRPTIRPSPSARTPRPSPRRCEHVTLLLLRLFLFHAQLQTLDILFLDGVLVLQQFTDVVHLNRRAS